MEAYASDWLQLIIRWVHLITGIAWIGASFYFVWLDKPSAAAAGHDRRQQRHRRRAVGGARRRLLRGAQVPRHTRDAPATPHWFKWEAYWTWISGFALLVLMYYLHAQVYLIDKSVADLTPLQAIGIRVTLLVVGWIFYDQLCKHLDVIFAGSLST